MGVQAPEWLLRDETTRIERTYQSGTTRRLRLCAQRR